MKRFLLLSLTLCGGSALLAQSDTATTTKFTMTPEQTRSLLKQLNMDSAYFFRNAVTDACGCIDSVKAAGGTKKERLDGVNYCINRQTIAFQGAYGVYRSMSEGIKEIQIATDPRSRHYQRIYFQLESALKDSCSSVNRILMDNDQESSDHSTSSDPAALEAYNQGLPFLEREDYRSAIPWFQKAVDLDPDFAFAWDNLGISYRKTNQLDKAVAAYRASLKADPKGKTPLQNLAVALAMQGKTDEAIAAYEQLLSAFPGDPEGHYGLGTMYYEYKKEYVKALEQFCEAYNLYVEQKSPYRSDAETLISGIYKVMKQQGQEAEFDAVLKKYHLSPNK